MDYGRIRNFFFGAALGASVLAGAYASSAEEIKEIGNKERAERIYEYIRKESNDPWIDTTGFVKLLGRKIFLKDGLIYRVSAIETLDGARHLNVEVEGRGKNINDLFIDKDADGCIDNHRKNWVYFPGDDESEKKYSDTLKKILEKLDSENSKEQNKMRTPDLCRGCAFV